MRLFKSSNKSQASLDRLTGSRDQSPTQQPNSAYSHTQSFNAQQPTAYPPPQFQQPQPQQQSHQPQPQQSQQQQHQPQNPETYYAEGQNQQHPAHVLSRTQSNRAAAGVGDPYVQEQQPTVKIVPPAVNPVQQQNQYIPGQTHFGQSQTARPDKEPKKSKRSIFGLVKKEDKEDAGDRRSVGRASSILKKGGPQSPQTLQASPRAPSSQYSGIHQEGSTERFSADNQAQDREHYRAYHEPEGQYRSQDQFDSPQSQHTRQSVQYVEDSRYQHQHQYPPPHQPGHLQQDRQYIPYQGSANNSDTNLPLQGSRTSASTYDTNQALRPPSQTSLGPPSPLGGQPLQDSRPSTSNTQQQRYSTQSQQQQPASQPDAAQQQQQIQQPQPQHRSQLSNSLPPSQQPTPQPTPQPQAATEQQREQLPRLSSHQSTTVPSMPRSDAANGRRLDEQLYPHSQQDPRMRTQGHEQGTQGRNTPPPSRTREDLTALDYNQLLTKHEELQAKYSKVKRYYFEREAQVTQLQNTVANQRLSMSKTSLDDAGYTARFDRLNGAIQNLSFNIRKDWRRIPNWLTPVCNRDAHNVGTKEMTAVGRACITRWLYESIFERTFHPGIDPSLSAHLKTIERTLRRAQFSSPLTGDQQDDLLTKITTWRLTTVEGLQDVLNSRQSEIYIETLVMSLTKQLEAYLRTFLVDPPPPGLADGLGLIIGLTVGIAQNIPLESRDICIEYFMPGSHITEAYMRLETGMTILTQPGSALTASDHVPGSGDNDDQQSNSSSPMDSSLNMNVEDQIRESAKAASASAPGQGIVSQRNDSNASASAGIPKLTSQGSSTSNSSKEKKGFLGGFVNKKPTPPNPRPEHDQSKPNDGNPPDHTHTLQSLTGGTTDNKIRFAAFLAVEVRGRSVLKEAGKESEKGSGSSKDGDEKKDAAGNAVGSGSTSALAGVAKSNASSLGANVLCKAPVYAFE